MIRTCHTAVGHYWAWPLSLLLLLLATRGRMEAQQVVPGERAVLQHPTIVHSVSFARNSRIVATASHNVVKIWDAGEAKELATLSDFRHGAACVAFSPDGKILATTARDEPARLYDVRTWKVRHKLRGEDSSTRHIVFSPDGKTVAAVGFRNVVSFWEVSSGAHSKSLAIDLDHVRAIAFSPDGTLLAVGGYEKAVIWDLKNNRLRARLGGHEGMVHSLVFSKDSKTLFTADSAVLAKLLAWDAKTGKLKTELLKNLPINAIALSPDGKSLAMVGFNPNVHLLDITTGRPWAQLRKVGIGGEMHSVAFSPDGRLIVGGGGDARIWEVPQRKAAAKPGGKKK